MIGTEMGKMPKNFEVRIKSTVLVDRETRFLVYEDEKKSTEVNVLEGSAGLKSNKKNRTVVVNEGHRATIAKNGKLSEPEEIDLSNLYRWWEK
jgi:ferric-dicitrate binding protein FerR (iron transport regulator)